MKHVLAAGLLVVAALQTAAIEAAGPVKPTLEGPTLVAAARNHTYAGRLVVGASGTPVLLADHPVGLWLDGVRVSEDRTDAAGRYVARVWMPLGDHLLEARAFEGTAAEASSGAIAIRAYATWPSPPALLQATEGYYWNESNVTWLPPATNGGHPVTQYTIERAPASGGPYSVVYTGLGHRFTDLGITPGTYYAYRASATTAHATSNHSYFGYTANNTLSTVDIVGYKICDAVNCTTIPDGGSFSTSVVANVTVEVHVQGLVDHYPVSPPGVADRRVHGEVFLPEVSRLFLRTSNATGAWSAEVGSMWARAPAGGCETFGVIATARTDKQGRTEDAGTFTLCV